MVIEILLLTQKWKEHFQGLLVDESPTIETYVEVIKTCNRTPLQGSHDFETHVIREINLVEDERR